MGGLSETARLRDEMVVRHLAGRDIRDPRVLAAFRRVERHRFVPRDLVTRAYEDRALPIGIGQTISQPYIVALMTQCLDLCGGEKVLEIGTGSGYQTAILAELAGEVYTVERIASLSERAQAVLAEMGYRNIRALVGDGSQGLPQHAPFDRIIITAAAPDLPVPLMEQLADGGVMVAPTGPRAGQDLQVVRKTRDTLTTVTSCRVVFVPLIGEHGYQE